MTAISQKTGWKHDTIAAIFHIALPFFLFSAAVMAERAVPSPEDRPDTVVIIASKGDLFEEAKNGLVNDLEEEFRFFFIEAGNKKTVENIRNFFAENPSPRAVVLIGNKSIRYYREFINGYKKKTPAIQVIAIMALDIQHAAEGIPNVQGIPYETPMITAVVNFRRITNRPFSTVGVLYRKPFSDFVGENTEYCRREQISVRSVLIGDNVKHLEKEIADGLKFLLNREKVEVLWIPNDNILLKPKLLVNAWLPLLNKRNVPAIVGVESLVKPELDFGTYAVIPEAKAIGEQAADLLVDLKENGWKHTGMKVYPAISMYSVLNLDKAAKTVDKKELRIDEVTKVLTRENGK